MSLVYEHLIHQTIENYDIGLVQSFTANNIGRTTHYIVETDKGKFFIKILDCNNENIHKDDEIVICNKLRNKGISIVPLYLPRKDMQYLTKLDNNLYFNVQKFIDGNIWKKYQAPEWLKNKAADFIADMHIHLKDIKLPQRNAIMNINTPHNSLTKLEYIEKNIIENFSLNNKEFLLADITLRKNILKQQENVNLNKLTFVNGHSDYTVTQLITRQDQLVGVVDFSEVSNVPAIWEIMRFYVNSSPECKEKRIDKKQFMHFIQTYTKKIPLNPYDKSMLFKFNLYYFCQALSVYDKLLITNFSSAYINRIISRNNTIQCLKNALINF